MTFAQCQRKTTHKLTPKCKVFFFTGPSVRLLANAYVRGRQTENCFYGLYAFKVLLLHAPATFETMINTGLRGHRWNICLCCRRGSVLLLRALTPLGDRIPFLTIVWTSNE